MFKRITLFAGALVGLSMLVGCDRDDNQATSQKTKATGEVVTIRVQSVCPPRRMKSSWLKTSPPMWRR